MTKTIALTCGIGMGKSSVARGTSTSSGPFGDDVLYGNPGLSTKADGIPNVQVSWVRMETKLARTALLSGTNDS